MSIDDKKKQILIDMIYGGAIGDAIGVPAEFCSRTQFKDNPICGMIGYGTHNQPAGTWSDDTSLTLCLLDAIRFNKKTIDIISFAKNCIEWQKYGKFAIGRNVFDIGNTTYWAIQNMKYTYKNDDFNIDECGLNDVTQNGNGAIMRIAPLALLLVDEQNINKRMDLVRAITRATHGHYINVIGCQIYIEYLRNLIINRLNKYIISQDDKLNILKNTLEEVDKYFKDNNIEIPENTYECIFTLDLFNKSVDEIKSSGYVVHTLNCALYFFIKENNYNDTILKIVNLGDDSDTVAKVAGDMAGIFYGIDNIPKEYVDTLLGKDIIDNTIRRSFL